MILPLNCLPGFQFWKSGGAENLDQLKKEWVSYKNFRNSVTFAGGFVNNSQVPIVEKISGRIGMLEKAGKMLGGNRQD